MQRLALSDCDQIVIRLELAEALDLVLWTVKLV